MSNMAIKGLFIKSENNTEEINKISQFVDEWKGLDKDDFDSNKDRKAKKEYEEAW